MGVSDLYFISMNNILVLLILSYIGSVLNQYQRIYYFKREGKMIKKYNRIIGTSEMILAMSFGGSSVVAGKISQWKLFCISNRFYESAIFSCFHDSCPAV